MSLKIGDHVIIEPITEREKQDYQFGWGYGMDDYLGCKTIITDTYGQNGYYVECDDENHVWMGYHLQLIPCTKMQLF